MERQIELFSIFGGLDITLDPQIETKELIKEHILDNFFALSQKIAILSSLDTQTLRLLKALATGNRKIFSAFNKAKLNNINGGIVLNNLEQKGLIQIEYSREVPKRAKNRHEKLKRELSRYRISHKVLFVHPFIRFWFYFIAPNINSIREKNYTKLFSDLDKKLTSYTSLVFEELSEILLDYHLRDFDIIDSGSYWDANVEIDIFTQSSSGEIFVAECKWSNHKVNKSILHIIKAKCQKIGIIPTQIAIFSKRGFSKELLNTQSKSIALYCANDFKKLLQQTKDIDTNNLLFN